MTNCETGESEKKNVSTYFICTFLTKPRKNANFDLSLPSVRRVIFQDLNGDYFVRTLLPTFDDLSEGAASEKFEYLVLVCHGAEHFMLDQLIVALAVGRARRLGCGVGRRGGSVVVVVMVGALVRTRLVLVGFCRVLRT